MSFTTVRVQEWLERTLPLALRFRDAATANDLIDGLVVGACPVARPNARRLYAQANRSGTYLLSDLPGLRALEYGAGDAADFAASPAPSFRIEVTDPLGRFLPVSFAAGAARGLLPLPCAVPGSPPREAFTHGIPLFSTPARQLAEPLACVHAELVEAPTGRAAAWALLAAEIDGTEAGLGLADREGRVTLFFAYPSPQPPPVTSPPAPAERFVWNVTFRAYYLPRPPDTPAPARPDLCALLAQLDHPRRVLDLQSPPQDLLPQRLDYGRPLVLRSTDPAAGGAVSSHLFIETA
ncbi:hypothetical protein [Solimonas soli]|uniref:hypothetical protein n=1 Tax=Solimonas soli TaxID=413479 RepID=UPI000487EEE7|nr:hypothetical protein [Solimonas soli]